MQLQTPPLELYIFSIFTSVLVAFVLAIYSWQRRETPGARPLAWLMLSIVAASLTLGFIWLSTTESVARFRFYISTVIVYFTSLNFLIFVLEYAGWRKKWLPPSRLKLVAILLIIMTIALALDPLFGWYYSSITFMRVGPLMMVDTIIRGPWGWIEVIYAYFNIFLGVILLLRLYIQASQQHRKQIALLLAGAFLPWVANIIQVFITIKPKLPLTYVAFAFTGLVYSWAIFRQRLFNLTPAARSMLVDTISDGMLVFDKEGRVTDINPAASTTLGVDANIVIGQPALQVLSSLPELVEYLQEEDTAQVNLSIEQNEELRHYNFRITPLVDQRDRISGHLVVWNDISGHVDAEIARRELAVLGERQRLARDLHDSVAQTLYGVNLFASATADSVRAGNEAQVHEYLESLGDAAQQAHKELRLLIYELRPSVLADEGVAEALRKRLETVENRAGIETHLQIENSVNLAEDLENDLYHIALEALNNALKHAQASQVNICIEEDENGLSLEVEDDGIGFHLNTVEDHGGLGLSTMRERARSLGGVLMIETNAGKGTRVKVIIPK
jgi:PAS domain S-box-containing protein